MTVSGNTFDEESFGSSTGRIWQAFGCRSESVAVFARSKGQRPRILRRGNITLYLVPMGHPRMLSFFFLSWALPWALIMNRPNVLQAQSAAYGGLAAVFFGRVFRIPVLVEVHGEHYVRAGQVGRTAHKYFFRPVTALTFRFAHAVRSLSPEMSSALIATYGDQLRPKIVEIYNRVDMELFAPPRDNYASVRNLRLLMVGALNENKNQRQLVEDLNYAGRDVVLTLVGEGPARQAIARSAGLANSNVEVELTGAVGPSELVDLLARCDIYIHYSRSEAVSRAVLEAMAMGVPVIVGPAGFLGGIVRDGETGVVLSRLDSASLRQALDRLSSMEARESLGRGAHQQVRAFHEWEAIFDLHAAVLRRLIGGLAQPVR